ncbi:MAG: lipopolysaccharide biosynthesis protein [Armatimonadota bacterium]|jgi:O-antigen/teichoic acid export membrane protein
MATQPDMEQLRPLTIRQNVAWSFTGNVFYAACQWGTVVAIAQLGSAQMLGQYTLGLSIAVPIIALTNLQLGSVQSTDSNDEHAFSDYFGLRIVTTAIAMVILLLIVAGSSYSMDTRLVIVAVGAAAAFEALSDIIYGLLTRMARLDRRAVSMMIKGPSALIALGLGVYLTNSVFWGAVALAAVMAVRFFTYDLESARAALKARSVSLCGGARTQAPPAGVAPRLDRTVAISLVVLALPLGITAALGALSLNIPRYVVEFTLGEHELGILMALFYFEAVGGTAINALGQSATAQLSRDYAKARMQSYYALVWKLLALAGAIGLAGVLITAAFGTEIARFVYGEEFAQHPRPFLWIMVGVGLMHIGNILSYAASATRRFRSLVIPRLGVTVAVAILSLILIPPFGLLGAAWVICGFGLATIAAGIVIMFLTRQPGSRKSLRSII